MDQAGEAILVYDHCRTARKPTPLHGEDDHLKHTHPRPDISRDLGDVLPLVLLKCAYFRAGPLICI